MAIWKGAAGSEIGTECNVDVQRVKHCIPLMCVDSDCVLCCVLDGERGC